jgi:DNA-binding NarL/FixJ family response regulator
VRRVLLVDDHPVVRQGIARILAAQIGDLSLTEAVDGASALEELRERPPHLVLLDLLMPGEAGLSLLRKIRREFPSINVLIVSMHPADQFAQRALQAGAVGYVAKDSDPQELVEAVRAALAGRRTCRRNCRKRRGWSASRRRTPACRIASTRCCG